MIAAHTALVSGLTPEQATALAARLVETGLLPETPDPSDGPALAAVCEEAGLSHAEIVTACSTQTGDFWVGLISALLKRPVYMCARGETGFPVTDLEGKPLPRPIGHRFGEAGLDPAPPTPVRRRLQKAPKIDPRVIDSVAPNPKVSTSASWARYEIYKPGMAVEEYVRLGGRRADIAWDVNHGFITLRMA